LIQIAFLLGLTGFAWRDLLPQGALQSARNFLMVGVVPFLGGLMLLGIFIKAISDYSDPVAHYSAGFLGIGTAVAGRGGHALLGIVGDGVGEHRLPEVLRSKAESPTRISPGRSRARPRYCGLGVLRSASGGYGGSEVPSQREAVKELQRR